MRCVGATSRLPLLKQYLLLYSSISLSKLAGLLETDEATLRTSLAALKRGNSCVQWDGGRLMTSGTLTSVADSDFYLTLDAASGQELVMLSGSTATRTHVSRRARII